MGDGIRTGKVFGDAGFSALHAQVCLIWPACRSVIRRACRDCWVANSPNWAEFIGGDAVKNYPFLANLPAETALPVNYLVDAPDVIYDPGEPALAGKQHDFFQKQLPLIVPGPVVGLYSNTDSAHGASLTKAITTLQTAVFQGRKSLKDGDEAVKTWRSHGGDTIKDEYGRAYQQLHGH